MQETIIIAITTILASVITTYKIKYNRKKKFLLQDHPLFTSLYKINDDMIYLNVANKKKEKAIKDFVDIKIKSVSRTYKNIAINIDKKTECDNYCSYEFHTKIINDIVKKYEENALNRGIPQIFLDKFTEFHKPHIQYMQKGIYDICNGYKPCDTKIREIYSIVRNTMDFTYYDILNVLRTMNGDLDKSLVNYK